MFKLKAIQKCNKCKLYKLKKEFTESDTYSYCKSCRKEYNENYKEQKIVESSYERTEDQRCEEARENLRELTE